MTAEERAAFAERLARALAWRGLMDSERASYRLRARRILEELVDDRREVGALWQLTLTDPEEVSLEAIGPHGAEADA